MNDQDVFDVVAKAKDPRGLRAVQLADTVDVDLEDAMGRLKALVSVGDLVETSGLSPNGTPCKFFAFSDKFKASAQFARYDMIASVANSASAEVPGMTKIDRAIAFVRERGGATSSELHKLLDLQPKQTASTWLAAPLRDGRLVKDGPNWRIGDGKPAQPPADPQKARAQPFDALSSVEVPKFLKPEKAKAGLPPMQQQADNVAAVGNVVLATRDASPLTEGVIAAVAAAEKVPAPSLVPPAGFRVGLWSDGVLEIMRDGATVTQLTQREHEHLADFIARLGAPAVAA